MLSSAVCEGKKFSSSFFRLTLFFCFIFPFGSLPALSHVGSTWARRQAENQNWRSVRTFNQLAAVGRAAVDFERHNVALGLVEELDGDADCGSHSCDRECVVGGE